MMGSGGSWFHGFGWFGLVDELILVQSNASCVRSFRAETPRQKLSESESLRAFFFLQDHFTTQ